MQSATTRYNRVHKTTTHLALCLRFPVVLGVKACLAMLTLLVLLAPGPIAAQSGAGSIQGTVEDATGAVIPGSGVQIVNVAKGTTIDSVANGSGFYSVPGLFAGEYTVT
jgi:Carboxypeptidase regulatory-like domain